jgi:Zn-dependent membrane protease YugP
MMILDFKYLLFLAPAILLALWAQFRLKSTYHQASQIDAPLSGAAAARHILDSAGLRQIDVEQVPGELSDHYDPTAKVLRLSPAVYQGRTLAAVGIAAHEAGHALQDAHNYAPLTVRNAAVPVANIGSGLGMMLLMLGFVISSASRGPNVGMYLLWAGIALFSAVVFFQVINLPVEYNASARAKELLVSHQIVDRERMFYVNKVLNAAALTYVAGTLQSVLTLLYYVMHASGGSRDEA